MSALRFVRRAQNICRGKTVSRRHRREILDQSFGSLLCSVQRHEVHAYADSNSDADRSAAARRTVHILARHVVASPIDQLTDLTGKASVTVTLTGRDNFNSEYRYDLTVRNRSNDLLVADSLIIVLEKITNLAGEEREPLKSEPILSRFDTIGQDGETDDGKPFFRVPVGASPDLAPLTDSLPVSIRIRNKDYVSVFTPVIPRLWEKTTTGRTKTTPQSDTAGQPHAGSADRQVNPAAPQKGHHHRRRVAEGTTTVTDPSCKACPGIWPRTDHFIADLGLSMAYLHDDQFFPRLDRSGL